MSKLLLKKLGRYCMLPLLFITINACNFASAQEQTSLEVTVLDQNSTVVTQGIVRLKHESGKLIETGKTKNSHSVIFRALDKNSYILEAEFPGFRSLSQNIRLQKGFNAISMHLEIASIEVNVEVKNDSTRLGVDNAFNARLSASEIDALPENPEELLSELKKKYGEDVLIRIDGFEGGMLPSKSQIASIKVTRSSFDAEFHEIGNSVIDIVTKAGTGKWNLFADGAFSGPAFNARNPFSLQKLSERRSRLIAFVSGPIIKNKVSVTLGLIGAVSRQANSGAALNKLIFEGKIPQVTAESFLPILSINGSINSFHSVSVKYLPSIQRINNLGIGDLDFPERGFSRESTEHRIQFMDSTVLKKKYVNQLKFEFLNGAASTVPNSRKQSVLVLGSFNFGGAGLDNSVNRRKFSVTDNLLFDKGKSSFKLGGEASFELFNQRLADNLNGSFVFSSLEDYQKNKPATYSKRRNLSASEVKQIQTAFYVQYDFRPSRKIQLGSGLRYELQNNLRDYNNISPRFSFTYAPQRSGRVVLRSGTGIFYQWFETVALANILSNNENQPGEITIFASGYPNPFSEGLANPLFPVNIKRKSRTLINPATFISQSAVKIRLASKSSLESIYTFRRAINQFRSRDTNAPLNRIRPDLAFGSVAQLESSGLLAQNSLETTFEGAIFKHITISAKYKLSKSISDFADAFSLPMDSYNLNLEKAVTGNDQRHHFNVWANFKLLNKLQTFISWQLRSPLPYTITTGKDNNNDSVFNERPVGVRRNSLRGDWFKQTDLRLKYDFSLSRNGKDGKGDQKTSVSFGINITNLFNQKNLNKFVGVETSPFFGKAISAYPARRVEFEMTLFRF